MTSCLKGGAVQGLVMPHCPFQDRGTQIPWGSSHTQQPHPARDTDTNADGNVDGNRTWLLTGFLN